MRKLPATSLLSLAVGVLLVSSTTLQAQPDPALAEAILGELVGYRTTASHPELTEKALRSMAARLVEAGLDESDVELVHPEPAVMALVARYRGTGERRPLLLMAHVDVVDAEPAAWSFDPFTFAKGDEYYYGRGTQDNKTGIATIVANFLRLKSEGFVPRRDLIAVITGDEETAGASIDHLVRERRELIDAELAINTDAGGGIYDEAGKPRAFLVQTSEKVYQSFRLQLTNPGGHSSLPRADNAIYEMAAALVRLGGYRFPIAINDETRLFFERFAEFEPPEKAADMRALAAPEPDLEAAERVAASSPHYNSVLRTTCVATQLQAGHAENALPRSVTAIVNCRVFPGQPVDEVEAELRRVLGDPKIAIEPVSAATPSPPTALSPEMLQILEELVDGMWPGTPVVPEMSGGATDGLFVRNGGIPVLGVAGWFLDDDEVRAHGLDERIGVREFHEGVEFWYRMLKRLAG